MLRTNKDRLVEMAVSGEITSPRLDVTHRPDSEGRAIIPIGKGGITYNVRLGAAAFGWTADHLEPGASIRHPEREIDYGLRYMSCIGNEAVVKSGEACGAVGRVFGEHSGILVSFDPVDLAMMCIGDEVVIRAFGCGLRLLDFSHIQVFRCAPELLEAMQLTPVDGGRLQIPVSHVIPSRLLASGVELMPHYSDQDLVASDQEVLDEFGLATLRIGDIVAITNQDQRFGRGYREGAVAIGVIIHGDSFMSGHGPGVRTLLSCPTPHIVPVVDSDANITEYLDFRDGTWRKELLCPSTS